jgi:small subunit ribosomal protein S1
VFVEISPGLEGLLHVSELGSAVKHPRQAVKVGQSIEVTVAGVDRERRRLSLGLAAAGGGDEESPPPAVPPGFGTLGDLLGRKRR